MAVYKASASLAAWHAGSAMIMMGPRLAWMLLLVGHANAQLGCNTQEDLLANLRWVRDVCEQEGEAFADEDTLVPSAVTTAECAQAVHRVAESCDMLLSRSLWFESRMSALTAATASASAAGFPPGHVDRQGTVLLADPSVTSIHTCGAVLEDGFEWNPSPINYISSVTIDVGVSRGHIRLDFEELTLDREGNDNLRLSRDERGDDIVQMIFPHDLPLPGPVDIDGSVVHVMLVSEGANRQTSFRATVGCVCEDDPSCEPDPCVPAPCQNGGTCSSIVSADNGGHRRLQGTGYGTDVTCDLTDLPTRTAAVVQECCDESTEDCSSGVPATCNAGCAAVLIPYRNDCSNALALSGNGALTQVQEAVQNCDLSSRDYQCTCAAGWIGSDCEQPDDPCSNNPCGAHGTCHSGKSSYNTPTQPEYHCFCDCCEHVSWLQVQDGCRLGVCVNYALV